MSWGRVLFSVWATLTFLTSLCYLQCVIGHTDDSHAAVVVVFVF